MIDELFLLLTVHLQSFYNPASVRVSLLDLNPFQEGEVLYAEESNFPSPFIHLTLAPSSFFHFFFSSLLCSFFRDQECVSIPFTRKLSTVFDFSQRLRVFRDIYSTQRLLSNDNPKLLFRLMGSCKLRRGFSNSLSSIIKFSFTMGG